MGRHAKFRAWHEMKEAANWGGLFRAFLCFSVGKLKHSWGGRSPTSWNCTVVLPERNTDRRF